MRMPNRIVLSENVDRDLIEIFNSVADYTQSYESGARLIEELLRKFNLIAFMPNGVGRLREDGFREAFCRGYRIVYSFHKDVVFIIAVIHCSRIYPRPL